MNNVNEWTSELAAVKTAFFSCLNQASCHETPYRHWNLKNVFPANVLADLQQLPFTVADLGGVSGTREAHNSSRNYFDVESRQNHRVCDVVATAFQQPDTVAKIAAFFGADIVGTYLRMEYAQDTDGFWLEPHTDIGVKRLTVLIYLSDGPGHDSLGTDIYAAQDQHVGCSPFGPNLAMVFVPAVDTWHGFEKRTISGVRTSIVLNYVTDEWRAREQLSFPDQPITL